MERINMNSFLDYLTKIINIINPVLLFMVLVSVISFLGYLKIKIEEYFKDINRLVNAVNEYKRVSKVRADEYALADLIK